MCYWQNFNEGYYIKLKSLQRKSDKNIKNPTDLPEDGGTNLKLLVLCHYDDSVV